MSSEVIVCSVEDAECTTHLDHFPSHMTVQDVPVVESEVIECSSVETEFTTQLAQLDHCRSITAAEENVGTSEETECMTHLKNLLSITTVQVNGHASDFSVCEN